MAARPQPLSALNLCHRLATTSVTRLKALVTRTKDALNNNNLLTAAERAHYAAAIAAAEAQSAAFAIVAKVKVPKEMPKGAKRGPGRPSKKDVAKGLAVKEAASGKTKAAKKAPKAKPAKKAKRAKKAAKAVAVEAVADAAE